MTDNNSDSIGALIRAANAAFDFLGDVDGAVEIRRELLDAINAAQPNVFGNGKRVTWWRRLWYGLINAFAQTKSEGSQ